MNLIKVLLLDDDDTNVKTITKFFRPLDAEVFFTSSINQAIDNLEHANPSLSLVSLSLVQDNN